MEDPLTSRLSWEAVYLHPIFKGQFTQLIRETAGSEILLTIKTYALSNDVDIISVFEVKKMQ